MRLVGTLLLASTVYAAENAAEVMTRLIANYGSNAIRPQLTYPGATDANSGPEVNLKPVPTTNHALQRVSHLPF